MVLQRVTGSRGALVLLVGVVMLAGSVASGALAAPESVESPRVAGPCPKASEIVRPKTIREAVGPLFRRIGASRSQYYVKSRSRARKAQTANQARAKCGRRVLAKSVYVRLAPRGDSCLSCMTGFFMSKSRRGQWSIWLVD